MSDADRFAWETFAAILRPVKPGSSHSEFEKWSSQLRVYADPTRFLETPSKINGAMRRFHFAPAKQLEQAPELKTAVPVPDLSKTLNARPMPLMEGDVLLNDAAVDYIKRNDLFSATGQAGFVASQHTFDFPKDAKEIKIQWTEINAGDANRYYSYKDRSGKVWGIVGIHLSTKDIPKWFWATLEHVDNYASNATYKPTFQSRDTFGYPSGVDRPPSAGLRKLFAKYHLNRVWLNYRLGGSQTSYTDSAGRPTYLGNNRIEGRVHPKPETVSCMTCHANSTVPLNGLHGLPPFTFTSGPPNPADFFSLDAAGNRTIPIRIQRDFVWSLAGARDPSDPSQTMLYSSQYGSKLTFSADILPLFLDEDIDYMEKRGARLWDFQYMKDPAHAAEVLRLYQNGTLPRVGKPWTKYLLDKFQIWMKEPLDAHSA